jgi:NAD+ kinase
MPPAARDSRATPAASERPAPVGRLTILTHQYPEQTSEAVRRVIEIAGQVGVAVSLPVEEVRKHGLEPGDGCGFEIASDGEADLVVVLGGDGTILTALREFAGLRAPVFAVNYGAIGFLSTVDRPHLEDGIRRALGGGFEELKMPALAIQTDEGRRLGVNDISFHRRPSSRVAELEYSVQGEQLGNVRCDGLVVSTPVGSTGYNLANGGPILAWGVEGFVVSFIAPHTLTARALVVAPGDALSVANASERDAVDVTTDGRPVGELFPGESVELRFRDDQVNLAQLDGATFYHRFREKFGRLAY